MTTPTPFSSGDRSGFKKAVKAKWPHVRVTTETISFSDLARCSRIFAELHNATPDEWRAIKALGSEYGIIVSS